MFPKTHGTREGIEGLDKIERTINCKLTEESQNDHEILSFWRSSEW